MTKCNLRRDGISYTGIAGEIGNTSSICSSTVKNLLNFNNTSLSYLFTTENIRGYCDTYNLKGKSVLTVIGSGDQVLEALSRGAEVVDAFDISENAIRLLRLKIAAVKALNKDEFLEYFCNILDPAKFIDYFKFVKVKDDLTSYEKSEVITIFLSNLRISKNYDEFTENLLRINWDDAFDWKKEFDLEFFPNQRMYDDLKNDARIKRRHQKSMEYFSRIRKYLSLEDIAFWENVYANKSFNELIFKPKQLEESDNTSYLTMISSLISYIEPEKYDFLKDALLNGKCQIRTFQGDVTSLDDNIGSYDYMFFSNIFDYQREDETNRKKYYESMARYLKRLKDDGIIMTAYCYELWAHYHRISFQQNLPCCLVSSKTIQNYRYNDDSIIELSKIK